MTRTRRFSATLSKALGIALAGLLGELAVSADEFCSLTAPYESVAPEFCRATYRPVSSNACAENSCGEGCGDIASAPSFCESLMARPTLCGDWFGSRTHFAESGFTFNVSTTQYFQGVVSGGLNQTSRYGGRNDVLMTVDGEKAGLWKGLFIAVHGESRYGESVIQDTGSLLPANLALAFPQSQGTVSALTGVKVMQFLSEDMLVFAGKINTFDDFRQPLTGAGATNGFMNTGLMINPVVVRTVPYSTFGAGFAMLQQMEPVFSLAVFDTNNTPTTSGIDTIFNNGASIVSNVNLPTVWMALPGHHSHSIKERLLQRFH